MRMTTLKCQDVTSLFRTLGASWQTDFAANCRADVLPHPCKLNLSTRLTSFGIWHLKAPRAGVKSKGYRRGSLWKKSIVGVVFEPDCGVQSDWWVVGERFLGLSFATRSSVQG
eukprot:s990_g16.t1